MDDYTEIIKQLKKLGTETVNPNTTDIDKLSALEIAKKINEEDKLVAGIVEKSLKEISQTAKVYAQTLKNGGRIFYIGAGTSGRLGVLDAVECPPTFGTDPEIIKGLISGGYETLVLSQEGVEDITAAAVEDLKKQHLSQKDMLIGIAASCRTPYTLAGLEYAQSLKCKTAYIVCNYPSEEYLNRQVFRNLDILISLPVGPEVITGSTRMKSGTAQKMTLNIISTTAMILMGKTYGNLMVDLQAKSAKLSARSRKILMELFDIDYQDADILLQNAKGSVKTAIVMKKFNCSREEAFERIKLADGFISKIK